MAQKQVKLHPAKVVRALEDLECIVVSLDRLGSSFHGMTERASDRALSEFVNRWKVFARLARLRRVLDEAYCKAYGSVGDERLERLLEKVPYWTSARPNPPGTRRRKTSGSTTNLIR
jgi:hypothetical protein